MNEKHHLYRIHSGKFIEEIRECLNCGKTWKVEIKKDSQLTKIKHFCSECNKKLKNSDKKRILKNKLPEYKEKVKEQSKNSYRRNIIQAMLNRAKQRAVKYGYDFDLTKEDIIIPDKCPILEVPFVIGDKGNYEYTPTIDRIDNSRGYTKDNIQIISKKANSMKNSATREELEIFCKNILRYSLNITEKECNEQQDKEPVG